MDILLIAAACIATAVLAKTVQPTNRDLAAVISVAGVAATAFLAVGAVGEVLEQLKRTVMLSEFGGDYIFLAFKVLGICYICETASSCCRDCGESALAGMIDISGRISISLVCLPLIERFIITVRNILELS